MNILSGRSGWVVENYVGGSAVRLVVRRTLSGPYEKLGKEGEERKGRKRKRGWQGGVVVSAIARDE